MYSARQKRQTRKRREETWDKDERVPHMRAVSGVGERRKYSKRYSSGCSGTDERQFFHQLFLNRVNLKKKKNKKISRLSIENLKHWNCGQRRLEKINRWPYHSWKDQPEEALSTAAMGAREEWKLCRVLREGEK